MISVTDLRAGTTYEEDGNYLVVISYEHIKMGRGSANIKVKVRNLKTGTNIDKGYTNGAKVQEVYVQKKDMQYLYKDDEFVYFMDHQTFDQVNIPLKVVPDHIYLKEGESFTVSFLHGEPLSILFPPKMTFRVAETAPGAKGNSATNVFKDAILENGLKTKVPLFIDVDELIRVDTRTGAYCEKAQPDGRPGQS
jgi:elongation factor P